MNLLKFKNFHAQLVKRSFYATSHSKFILKESLLIHEKENHEDFNHTQLHSPGENDKAKGYITTQNTSALLKSHLERTNGKVRTRFPPEPNGLLHIGHAKAINLSFSYARCNHGICLLRFDDTNPETGEEDFTHSILEMVHWLGFYPHEVSHASDYFSRLYELAVKLIEKNLAYVCHEPQISLIKEKNVKISAWRDRPVQESLEEFDNMKNRKYKEQEAVVRLKLISDVGSYDPIIYRIKYIPHFRTKDTWCIYPSYDFAHSLCDSMEDITHSLCTSEFSSRRPLYYWICNSLDVYCPVQTEFGKLNFLYTVVSKRKILKLIEEGHVKSWDDPRLFTLTGLRRRGIPPESINAFCSLLSFNTKNIYVDPEDLYHYVRKHLESTATRLMVVLDPLKVVISNFPTDGPMFRKVPNLPNDPSNETRQVLFDKVVWIERTDFKEMECKGFRRLTPSQSVGLKHSSHIVILEEVVKNSDGTIDHLKVKCYPKNECPVKPKAYIHWVAQPFKVQIRSYNHLFLHERPADLNLVPDGFLSVVNPKSLVVSTALMENSSISNSNLSPYNRFQFERTGYFSVDPDSSDENLVFNKIVDLKQLKGFKS